MVCVWSSNNIHWSGGTPECKPLSRFEDEGFRLALLVSFISSAIILVLSIIFITLCLVRHVKREERRKMERARKTEASEFWQQIDVEADAELQREVLHSQKTPNHNNNNSNSNGERDRTQTNTSTATETSTPPAGVHQGKPCPPSIHPSQFSLILSPPTDYLINTHMGSVPVPRGTAGDRHFCWPLWTGPHRFSPHPPPVQMTSI